VAKSTLRAGPARQVKLAKVFCFFFSKKKNLLFLKK